MKSIKNRRILHFSIFTSLLVALLMIGIAATSINFSPVLNAKGGTDDYTLMLDSSNKVTSAGNHVQQTKLGNEVTFSYSSVASSTSGHVTLNSGGTFKNTTQITSVSAITPTFSGSGTFKARLSYVDQTAKYSDYFTLTSGNRIETGSNPYFIEFKADGGQVTVSSIKYEFTCTPNPDAATYDDSGKYSITFKTNPTYGSQSLTSSTFWDEVTVGSDYISSVSVESVFPGDNGLKFASNKNEGSLALDFSSNYVKKQITTVRLYTAQYGSNSGVFKVYVNGSSSYTTITPSAGGTVNVNGTLTSLEIDTSGKQAYLLGIDLNYGGTVEPGQPTNPEAYEIGFNADDANKDNYTTNSIFDNDKNITVTVYKSDATSYETQNYTYHVFDILGQEIDTSEKFPAIGTYTLRVNYGNYVPVEITLHVGEYVYVTDVAAAMTKVTFTTADALFDYLSGRLTATVDFSNDTTSESIAYSDFAANGIAVRLLTPKGFTYDQTKPFGTAGNWTIKVYAIEDEEMYYDISIIVEAIPVSSITLSSENDVHIIYTDGHLQLTATVGPNNATNSSIVWSSSNPDAATVSDEGYVSGVAVGGTTITATAQDGSGVYGTFSVTVVAKPAEPTYTLVTSNSTLHNGDKVIIRTADASLGIIGFSGNKDATVSSTLSQWVEFVVGSASSDGWTLYDNSASKYIANPTANEFKYSTTGGTCYVDSSGHLRCNTRYLCKNDTYYRFYLSTTDANNNAYTPFFVYLVDNGTPVAPVYPTTISLSGTANSISIGGTSQLTVTYNPSGTNVKNVSFSSSNENVATVSNEGLITGVAQGSATITATAQKESGTTSATFNITVTPIAVTSVALDTNSTTVKAGKTVTLVPTVYPSNATNKNVTWTSSSNAIATVSNAGVVTGVAAGQATITVTTVDGSKTATCTVTVTAASGGEETFSITYSDLPASYQTGSTIYTADSGIKFQAYNCAGGYSSKMQFKASSGYLQTTEELELRSVTINDRESNTLKVYGSNTAGSFTTEITGENDVYDLVGYSYFKVAREASGAAYCSSITVLTGTPTPTDPTSIIMSPTSTEVSVGGSKQLSISYVPSNANQNKEVTWTSSNTNVATVSTSGLVSVKSTASAGQTATITARLTNLTSIYATCAITVIAQSKDDHTVLIYICGADLESKNQLATGDIQEMLKVSGQPSDVNIVIETGGASSWASTYGISSTKLERYHIENKSLVRDDSLTYASMGLTSTLQSFIEYGLNNYPAERVGLVLWNHGGGMRGVCYDEKKNDDVLKNSEVKSAVGGALSNCGMSGQKLEWIGYDACLMQVQDIAETNSQYFNYMVASEESEAGYGWDYDNWVDDLYAKKTTETILKAIVDSFISDNGGANSSSGDQTLSYLDLSYASAYKTAWENMAAQLNNKVSSTNKSSFNSAITSNVKHYGDSDYDYFCTFDAWDFIDKLANNSAFSSFRIDSSYTTAVKNAHANLVKYNLAQKGAGVSKGLCMYWPNSSQYSNVSTYYTTSETNFTTWRSFCVNKGTHA